LVNDGDSQEDTGSRSNGSHEISKDAKSSNADTTESGSSVDVASELVNHGLFSPSFNHEVLVHQLLANFTWALSADVNPQSGEERA
jgi:hypothetical protein